MKNILFAMLLMVPLTAFAMGQKTTTRHDMSMMQSCPMHVAGTEVATADSKDGIILTVTTKTGDVADLRRRTESMAKMHAENSNKEMPGMIPFSAAYEEVANGARLTLTPKDPARLEEFRAKVRQHVEMMTKGDCSMMQGMMQGMAPKSEPKPNADEDHSAHHPGGEK
jgi:hypothetical protein